MKKRISRVLNFFAFNLLFFALYLNFVHKDKDNHENTINQKTAAPAKGTSLVSNPDQYIGKMQVNQIQTAAILQNWF